jgi:hypothetical protein
LDQGRQLGLVEPLIYKHQSEAEATMLQPNNHHHARNYIESAKPTTAANKQATANGSSEPKKNEENRIEKEERVTVSAPQTPSNGKPATPYIPSFSAADLTDMTDAQASDLRPLKRSAQQEEYLIGILYLCAKATSGRATLPVRRIPSSKMSSSGTYCDWTIETFHRHHCHHHHRQFVSGKEKIYIIAGCMAGCIGTNRPCGAVRMCVHVGRWDWRVVGHIFCTLRFLSGRRAG